jgi:threonine dehydrogenase-like Zn-dependent dehydrogenase
MNSILTENVAAHPAGARQMRAAVVTGAGTVTIQQVPLPEPKEGQVRVRVLGCGVCASNLGPWAGPEWMQFPTAPGDLGHEGWGVIDAIGPGVDGLSEGDPVATLFYNSYAEYDVGPAQSVVRLPDALAGKPFPGEPLACAMNIFRRSGIEAGQHVAIIGAGFLGALLTRLATLAGAHVIAISRRPFSLEMARQMGAEHTIPLTNNYDVVQQVSKITGGRLCERVIEATGKQGPLDLATDLSAEYGRLIIAGYHQDGPRQINMQQWNWRGLDVINAHERDPAMYIRGLREAINAVEQGRITLDPLLTNTYPLEELAMALNATRDRPDGFVKALVLTG